LDVVLTILFSLCAILAVAGSLASALLPAGAGRLLGLLGVAVGTAGVLATFSEGFAALVALVCLGASALLVAGGVGRAGASSRPDLAAQLGAAAAALLLGLLVFVAVRGGFRSGASPDGPFAAAALGRLFFGRDALALEAVGAALAIALALGAIAWSRRA
jgi:hypothetical protein